MPSSCLHLVLRLVATLMLAQSAQGEGMPVPAVCAVCQMNPPGSAVLYVETRKDGAGERARQMVYSMALAARIGMNFGGVHVGEVGSVSHLAETFPALSKLFGADGVSMFYKELPQPMEQFRTLSRMQANLSSNLRGTGVFLNHSFVQGEMIVSFTRHTELGHYITNRFLQTWRHKSGLGSVPLTFQAGRPSMAVHLRRGDVTPHRYGTRYTPDTFYLAMINRIRLLLSNVDLHVFSDYFHDDEEETYEDGLGATLHLQEDITSDWAHFAYADIVILAKSTFSGIPAMLNTKCVIMPSSRYPKTIPLPEWLLVDQDTAHIQSADLDQRLRACLARQPFRLKG